MQNITQYINEMIADLHNTFGTRLCYVGLQGSYLRGEAHDGSDLDLMVVIDALTKDDLDLYRACLARRGNAVPSCGFLCGREELSAWNPMEILHVLHSTKDLYGTLTPLLPAVTMEDHRHFVQLSAGNLYHALCHRYVHGAEQGRAVSLGSHEKELYFLLSDLHYLRTGDFPPTRNALYDALSRDDQAVWDAVREARDTPDGCDYDAAFSVVFSWCQKTLAEVSDI